MKGQLERLLREQMESMLEKIDEIEEFVFDVDSSKQSVCSSMVDL